MKNSSLAGPLFEFGSPSPKSIAHSWSIVMTLPVVSFTVPTNAPVMALKALIVPLFVLLETSKVLLKGPKLLGAAANPQG